MMLQLTEEKLKELLAKAYEAGWYGVRELNESSVEEIYKKFRETVPQMPVVTAEHPVFTGRPITIQIPPPPEVQINWGNVPANPVPQLAPSWGNTFVAGSNWGGGNWQVTASERFGNGPTVIEGQKPI